MPKAKESVFLNIPYDPQFTRLYLAYIAALSAMGFIPIATLGIPGNRRLDRITDLIEACRYSVHDLSRVQLDRAAPQTPRFNMPFELGLAVAWAREHSDHKWFVFESTRRRINKSLSDLDGTDAYIHDGTVRGVMREICNAFVSLQSQPTVPEMMKIYRELRRINGELCTTREPIPYLRQEFFPNCAWRPQAYAISMLESETHTVNA